MNKIMKVGLLSLIAIVYVSMIATGYMGYQQMAQMLWDLSAAYKALVEETGGPIIDFALVPNPFATLFLLGLLGLFSTSVLLIVELRHKSAEN